MHLPLEWLYGLIGGVIIGVAVSLMLLLNGRVTGISGIINGALSPVKGDVAWRLSFVLGLFSGGILLRLGDALPLNSGASIPMWQVMVAGLIVGFGTIMGSGCTSGHGVCGISRLSPRSLLATPVFILAGVATVSIIRYFGGGL